MLDDTVQHPVDNSGGDWQVGKLEVQHCLCQQVFEANLYSLPRLSVNSLIPTYFPLPSPSIPELYHNHYLKAVTNSALHLPPATKSLANLA
jgi:hypothetical protein